MVSFIMELGGGLDVLFGKQKRFQLSFPEKITMSDLISHIGKNMLQERHELFLVDDTVRPGILVLINDADWELEGKLDYTIEDGDNVMFISTLHGG